MSRNPKVTSTRRAVLAAVLFTVVANVLMAALVLTTFPDLSLLRTPPPPQERQAAVPVKVEAPPKPPAVTVTPAHEVLGAVEKGLAGVYGDSWTRTDSDPARTGVPFASSCQERLDRAAGAQLATSQRFRSGEQASTAQLWVYGAGQGAAAFDELRSALRECGTRGVARTRVSRTSGVGAESFLASSTYGTQGVVWFVWRRGDALASVTVSSLAAPPATSVAQVLASRVDGLFSAALGDRCLDQDSGAADAARSPFGFAEYQPMHRLVPVAAAPVEDLQPLGFEPFPVPSFDSALPSASIAPPSPLVEEAPSEPARPASYGARTEVKVPVDDVSGPGCGWEFTGQVRPVLDEADLAARTARAVLDAQQSLAAAALDEALSEMEWQLAYRSFQVDARHNEVYEAYRAAYRTALAREEAVEAARRAAEEAERRRIAEEERLAREEEERLAREEEERRREEEERLNPKPSPPAEPVPSEEPEPVPSEEPEPVPSEEPEPVPSEEPVPVPPKPTPSPSPSQSPSGAAGTQGEE